MSKDSYSPSASDQDNKPRVQAKKRAQGVNHKASAGKITSTPRSSPKKKSTEKKSAHSTASNGSESPHILALDVDEQSRNRKAIQPLSFLGIGVSAIAIFFAGQFLTSLVIILLFSGLLGYDSEWLQSTFASDAYLANAGFFLFVAIIMVGLVWVTLLLIGEKRKDFVMVRRKPSLRSLLFVVPVFGYYFVISLVVRIALSASGLVDISQQQDLGLDAPGDQQGQLLLFFMLVVLPPIWEEVLFRGYLFNKMKQYGGVLLAYIGTSVLFGFAHIEGSSLNWVAVADTAIFSAFLIYISQRYRSLYPAMLLHALKNALAFVALFLL